MIKYHAGQMEDVRAYLVPKGETAVSPEFLKDVTSRTISALRTFLFMVDIDGFTQQSESELGVIEFLQGLIDRSEKIDRIINTDLIDTGKEISMDLHAAGQQSAMVKISPSFDGTGSLVRIYKIGTSHEPDLLGTFVFKLGNAPISLQAVLKGIIEELKHKRDGAMGSRTINPNGGIDLTAGGMEMSLHKEDARACDGMDGVFLRSAKHFDPDKASPVVLSITPVKDIMAYVE